MLSAECSETDQEIKEQILALFVWTPRTLEDALRRLLLSIDIEAGNVSYGVLGTVRNRQIEMATRITWRDDVFISQLNAQVQLEVLLRKNEIRLVRWYPRATCAADIIVNGQALRRE
jgi:hypothetical protein